LRSVGSIDGAALSPAHLDVVARRERWLGEIEDVGPQRPLSIRRRSGILRAMTPSLAGLA
jgi:hypothetical protein